jgi:hypothetical protein
MPRCAIANTHPQNVGAKSVTNKVQNLTSNPENVSGRTDINDKNAFIECKQIEARNGLYECTFGNNSKGLVTCGRVPTLVWRYGGKTGLYCLDNESVQTVVDASTEKCTLEVNPRASHN